MNAGEAHIVYGWGDVTWIMGKVLVAPRKVNAINYSFDITPHEMITSVIAELGIAKAPLKNPW